MEASEQQLHTPGQRDGVITGIAALLLLIGMPIAWLSGNTSTGDAIGFVVPSPEAFAARADRMLATGYALD